MLIAWVIVLCISLQLHSTTGQINITGYKQMPPLYNVDDYDYCLGRQPAGPTPNKYCVVYAEIVPQPTNDLWNQIHTFSSDSKRHFRHDKLFFGICLEPCKRLLTQLGPDRVEELRAGRVEDKEIEEYYNDVHKRATDEHVRYAREVGSCVNYDFQRRYNLTLRTHIEYCESSDKPLEYDALDISVGCILACIAVLNLLSSLYDLRLKKAGQPKSPQNDEFYKTPLEGSAQRYLTTFSVWRNYYRLTRPLETATEEDLNFFGAYRVCGVFAVIFTHCIMLLMVVPTANPEFFEAFYHRVEATVIQNGTVVIHIFFVLSGFLLYVNFVERGLVSPTSSISSCISLYFKTFLYRCLRLVPSLVLLILFHGTILAHLQNGPFWRHVTEAERTFCRQYWWKNLFFINNFSAKESCAQQTWYLAADMQLFEIYLIITILISKYPVLKKALLAAMLVLSIAIPVAVTSYFKLDALHNANPEFYRYKFFKDAETFYKSYLPFYTNLSGYLFGMFAADIYLRKIRSANRRFAGNWRYELAWFLIFPVGLAVIFLNGAFASHTFSPLITGLYAGLCKQMWDAICCAAILGMCCKLGGIAYTFSSLPIFRILGKLSYQAYLWHLLVVLVLVGYARNTIYINRLYGFLYVFAVFIGTMLVALLVTVCFEIPSNQLINSLFKRMLRKDKIKDNTPTST